MSESKRFDTGEVDLAYSEWDGDAPPVLVLHGITSSRSLHLAEAATGRHVYAYDHRGHGESGRTPGAYTFVDFGRDVIAFLRAVVREPAVLAGHSLGGMTAIYAAASAPELVKAAFLIDPPLYAPHQPLRDERGPFSAAAEQAGKPVSKLIANGMTEARAQMLANLDPEVLTMLLDRSFGDGWDTDAYLRRLECPIVLEHGDRDLGSAIYPGELERATALVRDCTVLHLAGTGHGPWLLDPDRFYAELRKFIERFAS